MGNGTPAKITQRIVRSQKSSIFESLGLFSPFTVRIRLLLERICKKHGQSWVEELSQDDGVAFKD